jgi:hypothetical protein
MMTAMHAAIIRGPVQSVDRGFIASTNATRRWILASWHFMDTGLRLGTSSGSAGARSSAPDLYAADIRQNRSAHDIYWAPVDLLALALKLLNG